MARCRSCFPQKSRGLHRKHRLVEYFCDIRKSPGRANDEKVQPVPGRCGHRRGPRDRNGSGADRARTGRGRGADGAPSRPAFAGPPRRRSGAGDTRESGQVGPPGRGPAVARAHPLRAGTAERRGRRSWRRRGPVGRFRGSGPAEPAGDLPRAPRGVSPDAVAGRRSAARPCATTAAGPGRRGRDRAVPPPPLSAPVSRQGTESPWISSPARGAGPGRGGAIAADAPGRTPISPAPAVAVDPAPAVGPRVRTAGRREPPPASPAGAVSPARGRAAGNRMAPGVPPWAHKQGPSRPSRRIARAGAGPQIVAHARFPARFETARATARRGDDFDLADRFRHRIGARRGDRGPLETRRARPGKPARMDGNSRGREPPVGSIPFRGVLPGHTFFPFLCPALSRRSESRAPFASIASGFLSKCGKMWDQARRPGDDRGISVTVV